MVGRALAEKASQTTGNQFRAVLVLLGRTRFILVTHWSVEPVSVRGLAENSSRPRRNTVVVHYPH